MKTGLAQGIEALNTPEGQAYLLAIENAADDKSPVEIPEAVKHGLSNFIKEHPDEALNLAMMMRGKLPVGKKK